MNPIRDEFLLDPDVVFLNHGSFGATPRPVFERYQHWQRELERQPVEFLARRFPALMAESRSALGAYVGTHADNLVYTQNATIALNIVARSLHLGPGDEVLSTDHEYGALDRTWRFLAKEKGFAYARHAFRLPLKSPEDLVESLWSAVTPKTRVIFISHITSPTAVILPVEEITKRARAAGILSVIDGAHVPGQLSLDLDALGADFYGGNLHKWLCAPKGSGFLFARPEVQDLLKPLVVSWGYEPEVAGPSAYVDVHEWWGTRDIAAFLSVPDAIRYQEQRDWDTVRAGCNILVGEAQRRISELTGLEPLHSSDPVWFRQMAAAPLPASTDVAALKSRLYAEHKVEIPISTWGEHKLMRVSVQGYNTADDIDALLAGLRRLMFNT